MSIMHSPFSVTFVIPGDNRSGGVRVTVIMANLLLERGHRVRIAYPFPKFSVFSIARNIVYKLKGIRIEETRWLHLFKGNIERYQKLDELRFGTNDIVIAVGSYMVSDVYTMKKPVIKVRYIHGIPFKTNQQKALMGKMTTISVSSTLTTRLKELSIDTVEAVVPNGIDTNEYYVEHIEKREGIGCIYSSHPSKGPKDMINLLKTVKNKWPNIPIYVFSSEPYPKDLVFTEYTRYPSVEKSRQIYNSCKIWLLTSYTEGLPAPVLEAMACGCVVISSDNDGSLEILRHEINGLVVPKGDLSAFIRQIDNVFSNDILVSKLLKGSSETIQFFSWERAVSKMENFLINIKNTTNYL